MLFDPKFLTVSEIADIMRISRGTVYRKIDSGDIESVRVGNSIRVPESVFVAYMEDIGLAWMVKEAGLTSTAARPPADPALEVERAVQLLVVHLPELRDRPYLTVTKVIAVWSDGFTSIEEAPPADTAVFAGAG